MWKLSVRSQSSSYGNVNYWYYILLVPGTVCYDVHTLQISVNCEALSSCTQNAGREILKTTDHKTGHKRKGHIDRLVNFVGSTDAEETVSTSASSRYCLCVRFTVMPVKCNRLDLSRLSCSLGIPLQEYQTYNAWQPKWGES